MQRATISLLPTNKWILVKKEDFKYVNLGTCWTPQERQNFILLFKQYRDVFTWTCDNMKTYDTQIIHHVIPIKEGVKSFQKKLRKVHPMFELIEWKVLSFSNFFIQHGSLICFLWERILEIYACACISIAWTRLRIRITIMCHWWNNFFKQYWDQICSHW